MNGIILSLLAETYIHPGTGQSATAIDLPVAREAATDYPFIAGSSLKGALRDKARGGWNGQENENEKEVNDLFGSKEGAGSLMVSDARLLLLPIRSLSQNYRWVTCPHILERLKRDSARCGNQLNFTTPELNDTNGNMILSNSDDTTIFLEERSFNQSGTIDTQLSDALKNLITNADVQSRIDKQLVIVSDDNFNWFAKFGLAVQARNVLDPETKSSKNLWYEESLPPDTLMYSILLERFQGKLKEHTLKQKLDGGYIQAGGNETVGQGWFAIKTIGSQEDN